VGRFFVIRGAGLDALAPPSAAPGLVVAEAGSVDPTLAGQVGIQSTAFSNRLLFAPCHQWELL
jgi:hypothetical protein